MSLSFDKLRSQLRAQSDVPSEDFDSIYGGYVDKNDRLIPMSEIQSLLSGLKVNGGEVDNGKVKILESTIESQNQIINQQTQRLSELENYIKQLTGVTQQHEVKIGEHDKQFSKYGDTLKYNKNYFDGERDFVISMLQKYAEETGNHNDGLKASTFALIVEMESAGKIYKGKVKGIMESLSALDKGVGSFKQEKMFGGYPHYRGLKLKSVYSNLPEDKDSLFKVIRAQNSNPKVNLPTIQTGSVSPRNVVNQLPQVAGSMSPSQSSMYNGAASPPPVQTRQ
jgi:hypothetical protein